MRPGSVGGALRRWRRCASGEVAAALPDSPTTVALDEACGIRHRMSSAPQVPGRCYVQFHDQVVHEVGADGCDAKLRFAPAYGDAVEHCTGRAAWERMVAEAEEHGGSRCLRFNLFTQGLGTHAAIRTISAITGAPPSAFGIACLRDRNCVATQLCSVSGLSPRQLSVVNDLLPVTRRLRVGDFKPSPFRVAVGELLAHRYDYAVRDVAGITLEDLAQRVRTVRSNGFPNFHGWERFGGAALGGARAHNVGAAMLRSDWRGAALAVLACRPECRETLEVVENGGPSGARDAPDVPPGCPRQDTLLRELREHGDARRAVLTALPRPTRAHCLSALQAYVWNVMASRRLAEHGPRVQRGDVVFQYDTSMKALSRRDVDAVTVVRSDAEAQQYALRDVCIPLLGVLRDAGSGRPLPAGFPELAGVDREAHDQLLEEEFGLRLEQLEAAVGSAALFRSQYRPLWADARGLQCLAVPSQGLTDEVPLLVTDSMLIDRTEFTLPTVPVAVPGKYFDKLQFDHPPSAGPFSTSAMGDGDSSFHALFSCVLPGGCYAGMLLRELVPDAAAQHAHHHEYLI